MRRQLPADLSVAQFVVASAAFGLCGCAENESSIYIRQVAARLAPECRVEADPSKDLRMRGMLDLGLSSDYHADLVIGNQMVSQGWGAGLRTETSRVRLEGAVVTLRTKGGTVIDDRTTDASGFVDPGTGESPGFGITSVALVEPGTVDDYVGRTVIATIRVFGTTLGGTEVESGDFTFPIGVCYGCLVSFPLDALDPVGTSVECTQGGETPDDDTNPCRWGENDAIDCRWCSHRVAVCKSPGG